ncbi:RDD family protein [Aedoeadaptatus urinae]|uniref:RDD family protein n=1 Tax=Aedoeadaptatus urinae TaxID=1871017 RepID=UPI00097D3FEE|nr:RDD family protein [Peptoniphilus urinae]
MKDQHYDPFSEKKKGLFHKKETDEKEIRVNDEGAEKISEPIIERADEKISEPIIERAEENPFEEKTSEGDTQAVPSAKAPLRRRKYPISAMVSAGFWIRTVAFIMDAAVAAAFASIFASPITALFLTDGSLVAKAFSGFFFYLYFVLSTYLTNGQTLGKMIAGIRVIHPDEPRLSLTTVIVREGFCRFIQTTFLLLYIITAFSERKQNLGDFLCDTFVVKDALYLVEKDEGDLFYAYEN